MTIHNLLADVDTEIAKWNKLRASIEAIFQTKPHHRPHEHVRNRVTVRKRKLSAKGRAAIKAAQKRRWSRAKKQGAKK